MSGLQAGIQDALRKHNNQRWAKGAKRFKTMATMLHVDQFSGVYLLCDADEIVYIGRTSLALRRVAEHLNNKEFDTVVFVRLDDQWANIVEEALIAAIRPRLNVAVPSTEWTMEAAIEVLNKAWKLSGKPRAMML